MKYVQLYEEFAGPKEGTCEFYHHRTTSYAETYTVDMVGKPFYVSFVKAHSFEGVWLREYDTASGELEQINSGKPREIIGCVTAITRDFISRLSPTAILILHIPMDNEHGESDYPNKRARINYSYLSRIEGYSIRTFNVFKHDQPYTITVMSAGGSQNNVDKLLKMIEPDHRTKEVRPA